MPSPLPEIFERSKTVERDGKVFHGDMIKLPKPDEKQPEQPKPEEKLPTRSD